MPVWTLLNMPSPALMGETNANNVEHTADINSPPDHHNNMTSSSTVSALKGRLVGKTLHEVPTPSIVLDLAKLEVNCQRMMDAAEKNGIGWRAHIKTHKVDQAVLLFTL